jgi:hypothetical protein
VRRLEVRDADDAKVADTLSRTQNFQATHAENVN